MLLNKTKRTSLNSLETNKIRHIKNQHLKFAFYSLTIHQTALEDCNFRDARYTGIKKYRGIKSDGIIYRVLAKYRGIPTGSIDYPRDAMLARALAVIVCVLIL